MVKNRILTVLLCIFTIILTITFSISLPIYIRPFYYAHIKPCNLVEVTGKTEEQIKEAYNEVLDFLTLPGKEFGVGDFSYSKYGRSHFEDCKVLFDLNIIMLFVSVLGIALLYFLKRKKVFEISRPFGRHFTFTCGLFTLILFGIIGLLASINFSKAFVIFHKIFFYGKDNWLFDYDMDQIITALPQEFFLNCAVLIAISIITISVILVIFGSISRKEKNNT